MLQEIRIENFAIIDRLDLTFAPGLNVITGETGAGKSIIIDAVELLLGGKADVTMVRAGADRAYIEGVFWLRPPIDSAVSALLQREDLDPGDNSAITLARDIRTNGRSTARVNGVTVRVELLTEIGEWLVDVHGQSAHLSLLKPSQHGELLDRYAGILDARSGLATVVARLTETRRAIKTLREDAAALARRATFLRDAVEMIDAAELTAGEDEALKAERARIGSSEQLAALAAGVVRLLYGDDSGDDASALDQLVEAEG